MALNNNVYDRYSNFRENGTVSFPPFVKLPKKNTDLTITYTKGKTRLDKESYYYYGDPNYGWLILMANPSYGGLEFNIPDGASLTIPYPLSSTLAQYQSAIETYFNDYNLY